MGAVKIVQSPTLSHSSAGFISTAIGDEIVILYNDNVKNIALAEDQKPVTTDGNGDLELAEAVISKDKKLEYRKLISETQKKGIPIFLEIRFLLLPHPLFSHLVKKGLHLMQETFSIQIGVSLL